jgi:hypothetical protein
MIDAFNSGGGTKYTCDKCGETYDEKPSCCYECGCIRFTAS